MATELGQVGHAMRSSHSESYLISQSYGFVRSSDTLNTLYLHMLWTNGHQTWPSGGSPSGASTSKFI